MPLGNAVACITRWLTSGLLLHKWAWLWGRDGCERESLLGDEQWKWLEQELLHPHFNEAAATTEVPPEVFFVLSSVQVWSTNPAMEGWGHFPAEQERLWNLLQQHYAAAGGGAPVIFLSGDVHHAEVLGQNGYLEVTSSGMTHHCGQSKLYGQLCRPLLESFSEHRHSPSSYFIGHNYGTIDIDWGKRAVTVQVHDSNGQVALQVEQLLDGSPPKLPLYRDLPHTMDGHLIPRARRLAWTTALALVVAMTVMVASQTTRR
jgi:hypothetical protein